MKRWCLGVTALLASAALPTMAADWNHIGSVTFGQRYDRQIQFTRLDGPVNGLRLAADGDIRCASINLTMADGSTSTVFRGILNEGRRRVVDLAGDPREVRDITFDCRSLEFADASIDIAADVDAPRPTASLDAFPGITDHDRWVPLGRETFGTRPRTERHVTGLAGQHVQAVGFEAVGADARCMRATAHYDDGDVRELDIGGTVTV